MSHSFDPGEVRYIKLGEKGGWARDAFANGTIPFGYNNIPHDLCCQGNWTAVADILKKEKRSAASISQAIREIREFYELKNDTLWITMAEGHLWWSFTDDDAPSLSKHKMNGPARFRNTRDGWHKTCLSGEPLLLRNLSSALTRTGSYRMTICSVDKRDYLLRRIRGEEEPIHAKAKNVRSDMTAIALEMIRLLHWEEFETLIDLIFSRNGWRRTTILGRNIPDVDLVVEQPVTGQAAWIQVKAASNQKELNDYFDRFILDGSCEIFVFACHSPSGSMKSPVNIPTT